MPEQLTIKKRAVQVVAVGEHKLGVIDINGQMVAFRLNDSGGFPTEAEWNCTLCKISNISKCAKTIPKGTSKEKVRPLLDACIAQTCKGSCGGFVGGGGVILF